MMEYRITKYNPQNRLDGKYIVHEWTSISDIGKLFDDGILTHNQYMQIERGYVECCIELLQKACISELFVSASEYYDEVPHFPNFLYSENEIRRAIMCCLREKCWLKLESEDFFIHFGYDYNMYVGTDLPVFFVQEIAKKHGLFCEEQKSPYSNKDLAEM